MSTISESRVCYRSVVGDGGGRSCCWGFSFVSRDRGIEGTIMYGLIIDRECVVGGGWWVVGRIGSGWQWVGGGQFGGRGGGISTCE